MLFHFAFVRELIDAAAAHLRENKLRSLPIPPPPEIYMVSRRSVFKYAVALLEDYLLRQCVRVVVVVVVSTSSFS